MLNKMNVKILVQGVPEKNFRLQEGNSACKRTFFLGHLVYLILIKCFLEPYLCEIFITKYPSIGPLSVTESGDFLACACYNDYSVIVYARSQGPGTTKVINWYFIIKRIRLEFKVI